MLLSDKSIRDAQAKKQLVTPFVDSHVQPGSYEVTLGDEYKVRTNSCEDCTRPERKCYGYHTEWYWWEERKWSDYLPIYKNDFILATTRETVSLPDNITARVEGKSSLGRLGLMIHVTAGFIDAGFSGQVTLELANLSPEPIQLEPGQKIGQLAFFMMTTPAEFCYGSPGLGSHYMGQKGPTESCL